MIVVYMRRKICQMGAYFVFTVVVDECFLRGILSRQKLFKYIFPENAIDSRVFRRKKILCLFDKDFCFWQRERKNAINEMVFNHELPQKSNLCENMHIYSANSTRKMNHSFFSWESFIKNISINLLRASSTQNACDMRKQPKKKWSTKLKQNKKIFKQQSSCSRKKWYVNM